MFSMANNELITMCEVNIPFPLTACFVQDNQVLHTETFNAVKASITS